MNERLSGSLRPKLGWLCSYTPVEIALAAGYLPVRIAGGEGQARSQDPRIYQLLCPFVRAVFHHHAIDQGPCPEAVVFVRCCDGMLRLHDVWRAYLPGRVHFLDLPKIASPEAVQYFAQVLRSWALTLGREGPREVTAQGLGEAIQWMNRARSLFREITRSQRDRPDQIPYGRVHAWSRRWLAEPTPESLAAVSGAWEEMMRAETIDRDRPRVLMSSSMLDQPGLIRLVEQAGLDVVAEDECLGARHYDGDVSEVGDPYHALAQRYLNKWPCPRMKGHDQRLTRLDRVLEEAGVQGVIALQLKFCDQSALDLPLLKARLRGRGVPLLIVENDYSEGSLGQLRTRIEAFAEMLQEPWAG